MLWGDTVLRGNGNTVRLFWPPHDGRCSVNGGPLSGDLFRKLCYLAEGHLTPFELRQTPAPKSWTIDGEPVHEVVYVVVADAIRNLESRETTTVRYCAAADCDRPVPKDRAVFCSEHCETRQLLREHRERAWELFLRPQDAPCRALISFYPSTAERRTIFRARRGDQDARAELVHWLAPEAARLTSKYACLGTPRADLEQLVEQAIVEAADRYPAALLHHPDPRVSFARWMEVRVEVCYRRKLRLWPYSLEHDFGRAENPLCHPLDQQDLRGEHQETGEADATHDNAGGNVLCAEPLETKAAAPPGTELARHDLPLENLLALAKEGESEARAELCSRFSPLIKKLVSPYQLPHDDLEQEARIAILKALDEYNPKKGTFARLAEWRIKDAIERVLKVEPPPAEEYAEEYDDEDDEQTPGPAAEIAKLIHSWYEGETGEWGGSGIGEGAEEDLAIVMSAVLAEEDRILLSRIYGLPGYERTTQEELTVELGVSQQAISKRMRKAVAELEQANWRTIINRHWEEGLVRR